MHGHYLVLNSKDKDDVFIGINPDSEGEFEKQFCYNLDTETQYRIEHLWKILNSSSNKGD
jgi:hypothetical protein